MATRQLSVKFDTEGFNKAIAELQAVGKAFDVVLANAQNAIKKAQQEIKAAQNNGSVEQMANAQKELEKNTKIANRAIAQSYRELGIKSSESLNNLRAQAVSAFEAIKNSGTATARDIAVAQEALQAKLKALENQLNSSAVNAYKVLGIESRDELKQAREEIVAAYDTLKKKADSSRGSQQELALAHSAMVDKLMAINAKLNRSVADDNLSNAFKLLGIRSRKELEEAENRIVQAYETIAKSAQKGSRDEMAALDAMQQKLKQLNTELGKGTQSAKVDGAFKILGISSEAELDQAKAKIIEAYNQIAATRQKGSRDEMAAYDAMQQKLKQLDAELGKDTRTQTGKVDGAFKILGIRSEAELDQAKAKIVDAYKQIAAATQKGSRDQIAALDAMQQRLKELDAELGKGTQSAKVDGAYKLLGIRSEAELDQAKTKIVDAYKQIAASTQKGSRDEMAALDAMQQKLRQLNAELGKDTRTQSAKVDGAYKLLGIRSQAELKQAEADVIAAFDLINKGGSQSARDIALAYEAMQQKLRQISLELNKNPQAEKVSSAYQILGVKNEAELIKARDQIAEAWKTISTASQQSARDSDLAYQQFLDRTKAINEELQRTQQKDNLSNAFKLLGVRSEAELQRARDEIIKAYELIKNSRTRTTRDEAAALESMQQRLKELDAELSKGTQSAKVGGAYKLLGIRSEAELRQAEADVIAAFNLINNSGSKSARDIALAYEAMQKKIRQIKSELNQTPQQTQLTNAYSLLGIRSDADLKQAQQDLQTAFDTIKNGGSKSAEEIARAYAAMQQKVIQITNELNNVSKPKNQNTPDAYQLLGIRSQTDLEKAKQEVIAAFNLINTYGTKRDAEVGQQALINKLKELDRQLQGTSQETEKSTNQFQKLANVIQTQLLFALSSLLLSLPQSIRQASQDFAKFDDQIRALTAVSGASAVQIQSIKTEIEELGKVTSKTPQEIAQLSVELSRAGFRAEGVQASLAGIVKAAEATGEDLPSVGRIIGNTLKAFNIDPKDSGRVADLLVQVANSSAVSITDLGESLKYVGTVANQSNQDLEDVLAVLGLMGNVALRSGQAGRNLAQTFEKMALSSAGATDEIVLTTRGMKTAGEAVKMLGVSFRDSDGNLRPFMELLPEIREGLSRLSKQDQDVINRIIFGIEGGRAIRTTLQATKKDIDFLTQAIANADGVADKTSKTMNAGLGGAIRNLSSSFEVFRNRLVEGFAGPVTQAIRAVSAVVNVLSDDINSLIGVLAGLAAAGVTGLVINAIKALAVAITSLMAAMQAAGGASAFLKGGLLALASPANLAAVGIGILVGALVAFQLDARKARADALSLGDSLDALSAKASKSALIEVDRLEASTNSRLQAIDRDLALKNAQVGAFAGMDWFPGNRESRERLKQEIRVLEAERDDIQQERLKLNPTRLRIQENINKSRQSGPPVPNFNRQSTAPPAPIPKPTGTTGNASTGRTPREKQEYYEYSVARPTTGPVTSGYGMRTFRGVTRMHDGIDYGAPAGTPIIAPLPGRVSRVAYQEGGAGHYVTIETIDKAGKKIEQTFMHLITRALVGVGESVKQGDLIGRVGSTGRSSGPHLHWGTRINGRSINPAEFIKMRFMLPSGDGKPSDYLRKADEEGVKAVEDAAKAVEDARKKAEEARQKEIETIKTRIAREGEDDRFRYSQRMGASLQEMKLEAIKAEGEADKQAAEDRVAEFELQIQTSLKAMELDNQLQQVEAEINILQKDRGKLTEQEIKRLDELLYQSTKIKREEQANNQEKKKALAIRKAQAEAERKLKLAEFREGLPRFDESVQSINLTPAQSSVAGTIRPFNDLLNELLQQITTAKDLGDTESIAKLETLTQQVEQARQKALGTQAQQILHQTKLNELTGDELAIYQELTALQEEFDARRQTIQALLSEARQSGYQQEVAMLEDLLNRTDQLERKQIQQVKDRFNILKQSFETVIDGMKSALETFFGDMFTGVNNLGGLINNLFSSILKSIAQVAARNVAGILVDGAGTILKSIGFGFADGGYVSGPGTSRSDSIMARLSNGEFVMSADSVKYWGTGFLNDINTMRSPQLAFNTAGSSSNSVSRSPKIVMNISTPDANSFRRSEAQVGRDAGEQLRRSAQRNG